MTDVADETIAAAPPSRRRSATAGTAKAKRAPARKPVRTRWSAKREARFLDALGRTSNVAASARAAGVAESTVYRHRRQSSAFRAAWAEALREGYARLEATVLARALSGVRKPIYQGGKKVGSTLEYDNRTALALLAAHGRTVHGEAPAEAALSEEELRAELSERTATMNVRMGGAG